MILIDRHSGKVQWKLKQLPEINIAQPNLNRLIYMSMSLVIYMMIKFIFHQLLEKITLNGFT